MKFYHFGNKEAPVIFLLPGTCCHWKRNFGKVIPLLESDFHVVCVSYDGLLWLVVDWYDFFVVDILLAPFDKFYKASGISAFNKDAVWFHFMGSLRGTVIGIVFAPIVGLLVMLL